MSKFFKNSILIFLTGLLLFMPIMAFADSLSDLEQKQRDLQAEIKRNQAIINQQGQAIQDLQSQLTVMNAEIAQAQANLSLTRNDITITEKEIVSLGKQIQQKEDELSEQKNILWAGITVLYKEKDTSMMETLLSSEKFSDVMNRNFYLSSIEDQVVESMDAINEIKKQLTENKEQRELKKADLDVLAQKQENQVYNLQTSRQAKNNLLTTTQGEQSKYQKLLGSLKEQLRKVESQIWANVGNYVSLGHVNKGDVIGYIGNTGYSTGPHLHFEVRNSSQQHRNPVNYIGNGYFIDPAPSVPINVPYGYSDKYFEGVFHTGIDKADGGAGTPVRAAAEGEIIKRVTGRPNTFPWSYEYGNYVIIKHTNGMYTLYGHLR